MKTTFFSHEILEKPQIQQFLVSHNYSLNIIFIEKYSFLEPEVLNGRLEQEILICQWFRTIVHKMFRVHGTNVFVTVCGTSFLR